MDVALLALFTLAAAAGGALNAVAGGGSFLTFPALLFGGVPPIPANATSAVALWPASLSSAVGYREELRGQRRLLGPLLAVSLVGGLGGALLLLVTPQHLFRALVPWLLLAATLVFALGPALNRRLRARDLHLPLKGAVLVQFAVATYGGYFGGGMGIMMLAAFSAMGMEDVHAMNGLKVVLGAALNGIAIVAFVVAGIIVWPAALAMLAGSIAGGYGGARLAKRVSPARVRVFVVLVGAALTAYFFLA